MYEYIVVLEMVIPEQVMHDLVEAFGAIEEPSFSNEQIDPSFYDRY